jgi:hypothetical protein
MRLSRKPRTDHAPAYDIRCAARHAVSRGDVIFGSVDLSSIYGERVAVLLVSAGGPAPPSVVAAAPGCPGRPSQHAARVTRRFALRHPAFTKPSRAHVDEEALGTDRATMGGSFAPLRSEEPRANVWLCPLNLHYRA